MRARAVHCWEQYAIGRRLLEHDLRQDVLREKSGDSNVSEVGWRHCVREILDQKRFCHGSESIQM